MGEGHVLSYLGIDVAAFVQKQLYCGGVPIHGCQHQRRDPQLAASSGGENHRLEMRVVGVGWVGADQRGEEEEKEVKEREEREKRTG